MRSGGIVPAHYDLGYMAECCLVLTLLGLLAVDAASRRVSIS